MNKKVLQIEIDGEIDKLDQNTPIDAQVREDWNFILLTKGYDNKPALIIRCKNSVSEFWVMRLEIPDHAGQIERKLNYSIIDVEEPDPFKTIHITPESELQATPGNMCFVSEAALLEALRMFREVVVGR